MALTETKRTLVEFYPLIFVNLAFLLYKPCCSL